MRLLWAQDSFSPFGQPRPLCPRFPLLRWAGNSGRWLLLAFAVLFNPASHPHCPPIEVLPAAPRWCSAPSPFPLLPRLPLCPSQHPLLPPNLWELWEGRAGRRMGFGARVSTGLCDSSPPGSGRGWHCFWTCFLLCKMGILPHSERRLAPCLGPGWGQRRGLLDD